MEADEEVEKCSECEHILIDEDYVVVNESRGEFWGAPSFETIVTGYLCTCCGNREDY